MAVNASQQTNQPAPIIVKKVKKVAGGHHGGAWKVAYADFVTAMMAFFLLLWLLNVTTSEQRKGIADYFSPASVSKSTSGSGGVLGGTTITTVGVMTSDRQPLAIPAPVPAKPNNDEGSNDSQNAGKKPRNPADNTGSDSRTQNGTAGPQTAFGDQANQQGGQTQAGNQDQAGRIGDKALEQALAQREREQFEKVRHELMDAIQSVPELAKLANNIVIDETPEGLRIQILDQANYSMFPLGSAQMYPQTRELLTMVAKVVAKLPNRISISGHTDSTQYANTKAGYGNWELSSDRANASRRALIAAGLDPGRIASVVGLADRDPFVPGDPTNPRNRRISMVLLTDVHHGVATGSGSAAQTPTTVPTTTPPASPPVTPPAPVIGTTPPAPTIPTTPPAPTIAVTPPAPATTVTPPAPATAVTPPARPAALPPVQVPVITLPPSSATPQN